MDKRGFIGYSLIFHEPKWLLRSGIYLVVFFIILLVLLGNFFTYNEVLQGPILLVRENPPVNIKFKNEGIASFLGGEVGDTVQSNSILAVLENEASLTDILLLKGKLLALPGKISHQVNTQFPPNLTLGTRVQPPYSKFYNLYHESIFLGSSNIYELKIDQIRKELTGLDRTINIQAKQVEVSFKDLGLQTSQKDRYKQLFSKGVISNQEWEQEEKEYLSAIKDHQFYENQIVLLQREKIKLTASIVEIEKENINEQNKLQYQLDGARQELLAAINAWEEDFLLKSPYNGTISYIRNVKRREFVNAEDVILTVIPLGHQKIMGKAVFPSYNFSKVKIGQEALIKIDLYPYKEWGKLKVQVQSMSALPISDGTLNYEVQFSVKSLSTSHHHEIEVDQELTGQVEILLDKTTLLEKIFHQL